MARQQFSPKHVGVQPVSHDANLRPRESGGTADGVKEERGWLANDEGLRLGGSNEGTDHRTTASPFLPGQVIHVCEQIEGQPY